MYHHRLSLFACVKSTLITPEDIFLLPGPMKVVHNKGPVPRTSRWRDEGLWAGNTFVVASVGQGTTKRIKMNIKATLHPKGHPWHNAMLEVVTQVGDNFVNLPVCDGMRTIGSISTRTSSRTKLNDVPCCWLGNFCYLMDGIRLQIAIICKSKHSSPLRHWPFLLLAWWRSGIHSVTIP